MHLGLIALLIACPSITFAEPVQKIIVEGVVYSDLNEITEVIQTQPGDDLDSPAVQWQVREDVRAIMALGNFLKVEPFTEDSPEGVNLIFRIQEKPLVGELIFEGNRRLKDKKLRETVGFDEDTVIFYDERLAETYRQQLLEEYKTSSYPNTTIEFHSEDSEEANQKNIVFEIDEGEKLPVREIVFHGNTALTSKELKKNMNTKESFWFIIKHHYDEELAKQDLNRIQFKYWDIGYLDVEVTLGEVEELDNGLRVHFHIEENEPYTLGSIQFTGNTIFSDEELMEAFTLKPGDRFSARQLAQDELGMINLYRAQGYLANNYESSLIPQIPQQIQRDRENHIVDLQIPIQEPTRKYLGQIEIQGVVTLEDGTVVPTRPNEFKTKDFVVEREVEFEPGEPLDWTKVLESDRKLVNLDYFKTKGMPQSNQLNLQPGFERKSTGDPQVENLLLRLEEKQTGQLSFGGGLSTAFGPSIFVTLSERNIFGRGIDGSVTSEFGEFRRRFVVNFREPHLLNSDYSLDWDIFYVDQEGRGGRNFDEERVGTTLLFGKKITDEWKLLFGPKIEQTDLSPEEGNLFDLDPATIPEEFNIGTNLTTSMTVGYLYDTRNFRIDPSEGFFSRTTLEFAGLADNEFIKMQNENRYFYPVYDKLVLALSGEVDLAHAYGDPGFIPLQERFFVGGANSIRGFDEGGIGRFSDIQFKNPQFGGFRTFLGGEAAIIGNAELRYPITQIFQLVGFLDMGAPYDEIEDIDPSDFRFSTGAGIRVRIPGLNALLRLDFPIVLRDFDEDDTEFFHFSFGQSF